MIDMVPAYLDNPAAGQEYLALQRAAQDVLSGIVGRAPTLTFLGRRPVTAANLAQPGRNMLVELQFEHPKDMQHSIVILANDADLARLFALDEIGAGEDVLTAEALLSLGDMFSSFLDAIGNELPWLAPSPRAWLSNLEPISTDASGNPRFDLPPILAQEEPLHEIVLSATTAGGAPCQLVVVMGEKGEQALLGLNGAEARPQPTQPTAANPPTASHMMRSGGNIHAPAFKPLAAQQPATRNSSIDLIRDVPLKVTVELGRASLTVREILALGAGSVVELDRLAGESVDVLVNDRLIARGEVVIVDESFGVRVTELLK